MLRSRLASWMVFAGVLFVLASIGLLSSLFADWEQANGSRRLQKLTVNVDRTFVSASSAGLTLQEADQLAKQWSSLPVAYEAKARTQAVFGSHSDVDVVGVNEPYRYFADLKMKAGTSIAQASVDEHSRVTVIGAQVADRLFHTEQVVGKTIELFGISFTVIGVFDDEGSLLRQMSDDGIPDVLIPVTAMFDVKPDARIDTIQLAAKPDASIRGEAAANEALRAIGQNSTYFHVENDVLAHVRITQLRSLLVFGCGIIAIFLLARLILRQFAMVYGLLQCRFATHNWTDAFWIERYRLLKYGLAAVGMAFCVAALRELIRFRLYIPPDWMPEEIIDLSFYMDKLRSLWQQQTAQAGYVPSSQELLSEAAGRLSGWLFFIGALFGLPLFLLGVRLWTMGRLPIFIQLQRLFLYIPIAALFTFAAAHWAGMNYRIEPLEYLVPGALFIFTIVHFNYSKGVKLSYVENRI